MKTDVNTILNHPYIFIIKLKLPFSPLSHSIVEIFPVDDEKGNSN